MRAFYASLEVACAHAGFTLDTAQPFLSDDVLDRLERPGEALRITSHRGAAVIKYLGDNDGVRWVAEFTRYERRG